jgi:hypothetical protein
VTRAPIVLDAATSTPFRGSQACRDGHITPGRLRGPSFVPIYPDTYVGSLAEITPAVRRLALREWLGPEVVVTGSLAAEAVGAPTVDELVEVVLPRNRRPRHPEVLVHHDTLLDAEVAEVDGVRITTPRRTAFDLARRLDLPDGVAMADALARYHPVTASGLRLLARRHPHVRGVRRVFEVARWMRPGAESLPESRLRLSLVLRGVPEPIVQLRIVDDRVATGKRVLARPDLAWREYRVALEYDGAIHLQRERRPPRHRPGRRAACPGLDRAPGHGRPAP